jgi:hypothetical protein
VMVLPAMAVSTACGFRRSSTAFKPTPPNNKQQPQSSWSNQEAAARRMQTTTGVFGESRLKHNSSRCAQCHLAEERAERNHLRSDTFYFLWILVHNETNPCVCILKVLG